MSLDSGTSYESELSNKRMNAKCLKNTLISYDLNNGRVCTENKQCVSTFCNETDDKDDKNKYCIGNFKDFYCNHHSDCNATLYCEKLNSWPYLS